MTFYAEDVFKVWQRWTAHAHDFDKLRPDIEVVLDESIKMTPATTEDALESPIGIYALDVGYSRLRSHLEKAMVDLADDSHPCTICKQDLSPSMALVCPSEGCGAVGHVGCFASLFLQGDGEHVVPTAGSCPSCGKHLQWIDLVKELSLRIRGEDEVKKIFKIKKPRAAKKHDAATTAANVPDDPSDDDEEMADDWHLLSESSEDEVEDDSIRSDPTGGIRTAKRGAGAFATRSEPVIEDSDWDDAEIVM